MAQFNITITEELLHGLFLSNDRDEAFSKLDEVLCWSGDVRPTA
jgi:hypothetical protein